MVARTTRWTLLLALALFLGAVAYVGTHPRLLAPWFARLATNHLLRGSDGSIRIREIAGNPLKGLELHDATLSLHGERGAVVVVGIDTLQLQYDFRELLRGTLALRRVTVAGAEIRARRGAPRAPGEPAVPGSPFDLPAFRVDDLTVRRALLVVSGADGRVEEQITSLDWRGGVRADGGLVLACRDADIDWASRATRLRDLTGYVEVDDAGVSVRQLSALVNGSHVTCEGSRRHDGDLDLDISALDVSVPEVENLIDMTLGFVARGDAQMRLKARGDTVSFDVGFTGELEGYRLDGMSGRAVLSPTELVWDSLEGRINGAWFAGDGVFDVTDPLDVTFVLEGDVADVDLSQGLVPETDLPPTGGHGWLHLWRRDAADLTQVSGWLSDGFIADVPFDTMRVEVDADPAGVTFRTLDLAYRGQRAHLSGRADSAGLFAGRATVDVADLGSLPPQWDLPALRGRLGAEGEVTGRDPVYRFAGAAILREAGVSALSLDSCRVNLAIEDVLGAPAATLEAVGGGLVLAGVPMGAFTGVGAVSSDAVVIEHFRTARGDTTIVLRGRGRFHDGLADFEVPQLEITLEGSRWSLSEPALFQTGPGRLQVDRVLLASRFGELDAHGVWDETAGALDGEVALERFDLGLVNLFLPGDDVFNGEVSAQLSLGGSPAEPLVGLEARLTGSRLPQADLDSLTVSALFYEGNLDLRALDLVSNYGRVHARGLVSHPGVGLRGFWDGAALDLDLDIEDADWAFLDQFAIPSLDRLSGAFDGSLKLSGDTRRPVIAGGIESRPFNVHWLHLDELRGTVGYADGVLTLGDLAGRRETLPLTGRLEIPLQLDFLSVPVSPVDGPFLMSLSIPDDTDLKPLARTCNAFVESGGRGGLTLVVEGPANHPLYHGRVTLRDGSCVLRGLSEVYAGVSCDGEWEGDVLTVRDLRAREGARGSLAGGGTLTFKGLVLERFDFAVDADRFLVASIPDLRALVRGRGISLTGVKVGPDELLVPSFAGDLEIIEARFTGDFSEQPSVSDPRVATVAPDWLADLRLQAPPRSIRVVNRTMELFLSGEVRLLRDMGGMNLSGHLNIDQGRLPVFNNDFKVSYGGLDFTQERGVIPEVGLTAETSVRLPAFDGGSRRLEKIYVDVTGSALAPQVAFRSESGYARSNIERMLLGMTPNASDVPATSAVRQGTMAAGFNLLEREVAAELDLVDTFDIESGRVREDGTTQTLIGVGKYIGRDLYVKFAQAVTDQDREIVVEYQINDHLLLQSEVSRRANEILGDTTYNLDLKYRFEY
ncbi:MAG: translocation/assembly module TamB domain-containing protein [Candidatus Latescibacteria bacterium]|nr:translocation/assembly module TamB domain-containing protein [Candidatus Latescibacterota bacterium]